MTEQCFLGARVADVADALGLPLSTARHYLRNHGYRIVDNRATRVPHPNDIQDRLHRQIAQARPSAPCFRCGAARECEHR